jgi:hypothetical protein
MQLFLVASLPLLFCIAIMLPWGRGVPPRLNRVTTFLKGVLLFFPGYLVILILRGVAGFSYNGFLLFLSILMRDHLAPLLTAVGAFLLLQRALRFSGTDEGTFLTVFCFLSGFLGMVNLTDLVRMWNVWTWYDLFLLPGLRLAAAIIVALLAPRYFRWEGRSGWFYALTVAGLAVLLAVASFLGRRSLPAWSIASTIALVAAGMAAFAMRFPRVLRG